METLEFAAAPHPDLLVAPEARFQRDKDGEKGKKEFAASGMRLAREGATYEAT